MLQLSSGGYGSYNSDSRQLDSDGFDNISEITEVYSYQQNTIEQSADGTAEIINEQYRIAHDIIAARKCRLESKLSTRHETLQKDFIKAVARGLFGDIIPLKDATLTGAILKKEESQKVGSGIFGALKADEVQREFFFDGPSADERYVSWFFHQVKRDSALKTTKWVTFHYEVQPAGVLKICSNPSVETAYIAGEELANFVEATRVYHDDVMDQMYSGARGQTDVAQLNKSVYQIYDGTVNSDNNGLAA